MIKDRNKKSSWSGGTGSKKKYEPKGVPTDRSKKESTDSRGPKSDKPYASKEYKGRDNNTGRTYDSGRGSSGRPTGSRDGRPVGPRDNRDTRDSYQDRGRTAPTGTRPTPAAGSRDTRPAKKEYGKELDNRTRFIDQQEEDDDNINLIEGRNPVLEALKSGREIDKLFVQKGETEGSIRQIIAIAREKKILIKEVDKAKLDGLSTTRNHQGVIASAALYKYYEIDELLQIAADKGEDAFIVILDEITDNNNLGSILRSADAAGVHGVVIPKRRAVGLTPVVAKTSAGAVEYVPVSKVTNINQTMEYLKKKGLWIVGADMKGETYYEKDMKGPIALVIGSEGEGMGRLIRENCDFLVKIPMKGKIASLNAGVSAAVIMFEINKQRSIVK